MTSKRSQNRSSFLYRSAEDARRGRMPCCGSIDGIRRNSRSKQLRRKGIAEYRWVLVRFFAMFDVRQITFALGKRGVFASMVFGMIVMGSATYFFGQGALARQGGNAPVFLTEQRVLGDETSRVQTAQTKDSLEQTIRSLVEGYPIEDMVPYIVEQDPRVAAYLVAIAKKESNWGKRVPVYYGENCFNYWGYRGQDEIMGSAGHTCFDTPKEAVAVVGKRLNTLVVDQGRTTANDLILWKCGSSCAGHGDYSVRKWISDVDMYYRKVSI